MAIKVLHIITKLELGGAQKNALSILAGLDRSKYEAHLISSDGLLSCKAADIPGLHLKLVPFLKRMPDPFSDILAFFFMLSYMRREKIDIVHTHSSKAGILGRWAAHFAGIRVIIHTVHGWGFHDYLKSFINNFYIFLERKAALITTRIVAVSQDDIRKGLENGIGSKEKYVLIRCGVAPAPVKEAGVLLSRRHSLGFTQDDLIVGMVSCLKPQKNPVDFVIAAGLTLEDYPQAKFVLIGDGELRKNVELEISNIGLQDSIFMLGWRTDAEEIISIFDIVVLTSLWEGLPLVFLEAMCLAKPIVAYDICGSCEAVKDGVNGFLARPGDTRGLSANIGLLLRDPGLRARMGQFGLHIVSSGEYSLNNMISRIDGLYENELRAS